MGLLHHKVDCTLLSLCKPLKSRGRQIQHQHARHRQRELLPRARHFRIVLYGNLQSLLLHLGQTLNAVGIKLGNRLDHIDLHPFRSRHRSIRFLRFPYRSPVLRLCAAFHAALQHDVMLRRFGTDVKG